ncbi:MAG: hypothetical protein IT454_06070 [Planctomycetes bacterium]|nr:hypothetical protein [Planctomycetota bacterium]
MNDQPTALAKLSPWTVRAAACWVLVVSLIKMEQGSPNDIPEIIRESFLGPDVSFLGAISVELAFSLAALVRPQLGWMLMSALMSVFVAVLLHLISIGATSCGCFGGAISLSPYAMLAIDGTLFAALLVSRPWASIRSGKAPWTVVGLVFAVGAVTPWIRVQNQTVVLPPKPIEHRVEAPLAVGATQPTAGAQNPSSADATQPAGAAQQKPANDGLPKPNSELGNLAPQTDAAGQWTLPETLPRWARLRPPDWVGKSIHETELAIWMNTHAYPEDATWILYLETCTHCRDYLKKLDEGFANDPKIYVFVRLSTKDDASAGIVEIKPPGEQAALPPEVSWVVGPELPPWELVLEGGKVISATHHGD